MYNHLLDKNILRIKYLNTYGSGFLLPSIDKKYMYIVTAFHVLNRDLDINFGNLSIYTFENDKENKLNLELLSCNYDEILDLCVIQTKYDERFPTIFISEPFEKEQLKLVGYPNVLSETPIHIFSLDSQSKEKNDTGEIFVQIKDSIANFHDDEHLNIEGFSGGAFIASHFTELYFLGIETGTVTEHTSYDLVKGISGLFIAEFILKHFYIDDVSDLSEVFMNQTPNIHKIECSSDEQVQSFRNAIQNSKIGISNIVEFIGADYEINRSEIIKNIRDENYKFISIQGEAGSGKSALCKKILKNEKYVLYARAESFVQAKNINEVWICDINYVLHLLLGEKIFFFIDALEFIADCYEKNELMQQLYEIVEKHENAYIYTSCRSSDKNAFIKLESHYNIKAYELGEISTDELEGLLTNFPILKGMIGQDCYCQLLKSPFYINLVINNELNIKNIKDENSLRALIMEEAIFLKSKVKKYKFSAQQVVKIIENIVFQRAKEFTIGIHKDEIETDILNVLVSEGVVVEKNDYIRLRYDIFEDIIFEHHFDKIYEQSKGDYGSFYGSIEEFGRCVYRRYQIWISNKLFIKDSREKFINQLIFNNTSLHEWRKQTEIGIVKSPHCYSFFEEYEDDLVDNDILSEFISIVNLYAFSPYIWNRSLTSSDMILTPIGKAREKLISLIEKNSIYCEQSNINKYDIIKMCSDYSKVYAQDINVSSSACKIIEYFIDTQINNQKNLKNYNTEKKLTSLLIIIFNMADASSRWIDSFFDKIILYYESENRDENSFTSNVVLWILKNTTFKLAKANTHKLCKLAKMYWIEEDRKQFDLYYYRENNNSKQYGLNTHADKYSYDFHTIKENKFYFCLINSNFNFAIHWAIDFVNNAFKNYANNNSNQIEKVKLLFIDNDQTHEYYADRFMWLAGVQENVCPMLISDIIYITKSHIIEILETVKGNKSIFNSLANHIKETIYLESNNIAFLTIIESIGLHFESELPGFALDLSTSLELVVFDFERSSLYMPNPTKKILEKHIFESIGIPHSLRKPRYKLDEKCKLSLQEYVFCTQLKNKKEKNKCNKICDYLYSIYPNDKETALENFQIQKMDARNIVGSDLGQGLYLIEPEISGEAKNVLQSNEEMLQPEKDLKVLMEKALNKSETGDVNWEYINKSIDYIIELSENEYWKIQFENTLIVLIAASLEKATLSNERRNELCSIWLDKVTKIFSHEPLITNENTIVVLLAQLNSNISETVKDRIKKFMFECIINKSDDGRIFAYESKVKKYLLSDNKMSYAIFNTIISFAYKNNKLQNNNEEIINKFLYKEEELDLGKFNIEDFDITVLLSISNCGLSLNNNDFFILISKILQYLYQKWSEENKNNFKFHVYQTHKLIEMFHRELQTQNNYSIAIDLLFNSMDFSALNSNIYEFYQDIFNYLPAAYFDGHSDKNIRKLLQKTIIYLEKKINQIENQSIRIKLYKPLIMSLSRYGASDWSNLKTSYSFKDKEFLNQQFLKYGKYHFKDMMYTIYQFHIDELLPEILISLSQCLIYISVNGDEFISVMEDEKIKFIVEELILKSFINFSDIIKRDSEQTEAFEIILNKLIEINNEKAAIILDEFRIH